MIAAAAATTAAWFVFLHIRLHLLFVFVEFLLLFRRQLRENRGIGFSGIAKQFFVNRFMA